MLKAITAVKSGQFKSVEAAAIHFDIHPSTLQHCVKGYISHRASLTNLQKLSPSQEDELGQWITQLSITDYSSQHSLV